MHSCRKHFVLTFILALTLASTVGASAETTNLPGEATDSGEPDERTDASHSSPRLDASNGDSRSTEMIDASKDGGVEADAADALADSGDGGTGPKDCGAPPGLVFTDIEGPFCPFQANNVFDHCAVGEHCCEYAAESALPSTCNAGATACAPAISTGFDWRCDETNDCPANQVCCFDSPITPDPSCSGHYRAPASAAQTACRPGACLASETRTCGSQADCPVGTKCTGMRFRGKHFGFCKP